VADPIDKAFRDRAPRIERIDSADQIVVEAGQILSGIGLISNAGARFEAPETISAQGGFEDVHRGGYDAEQHLKDMELPSDFFRRNVVLSFQEDAIGIRLRDVIGIDNMMWGSDYPHSESTFPQSRKIVAAILAGVPDDE
jgi:hypothetical protein